MSAFIDSEDTVTLKTYPHRTFLNVVVLLTILVSLFSQPAAAFALGSGGATLPNFAEFSKSVQNNQADVLRGVYVPEVLALPIVRQPAGNAGYVSSQEGEITQFGMAAQFGNVGLLAHNHLSGRLFSQLAVGQEVRLIYGDGMVEYFVVTKILQFQAMQPTSPYSSFRDLSNDEMLTAEQVFNKVYRGERHVTLQTCIANNESLSWGRLFVMAVPKTQVSGFDNLDRKTAR